MNKTAEETMLELLYGRIPSKNKIEYSDNEIIVRIPAPIKDGSPRFCKDCEFFRDSSYYETLCVHPKNMISDPVKGNVMSRIKCEDERKGTRIPGVTSCGAEGQFYKKFVSDKERKRIANKQYLNSIFGKFAALFKESEEDNVKETKDE